MIALKRKKKRMARNTASKQAVQAALPRSSPCSHSHLSIATCKVTLSLALEICLHSNTEGSLGGLPLPASRGPSANTVKRSGE